MSWQWRVKMYKKERMERVLDPTCSSSRHFLWPLLQSPASCKPATALLPFHTTHLTLHTIHLPLHILGHASSHRSWG